MSSITAEQIKELRERTGVGLGKCKAALEENGGNIERAIEALRKAGVASAVKKESRVTNEGRIRHVETADGIAVVEMNAETDFVVNNERFSKLHHEFVQDLSESMIRDLQLFLNSHSRRQKDKTIDEERKELISVLGENIIVSRMLYLHKEKQASYGVYSHMNGKILCIVELTGAAGQDEFAREIGMHIAAEAPEFLSPEEVPAHIKEKEEEIARSQVAGAGGNKPADVIEKIVQGKVRSYYDQVCLLNQKYIKDNAMTVAQLVANYGKKIGKEMKISRFVRWQIGGA